LGTARMLPRSSFTKYSAFAGLSRCDPSVSNSSVGGTRFSCRGNSATAPPRPDPVSDIDVLHLLALPTERSMMVPALPETLAITRNSSKKLGSGISKGGVGAASITTPRCASWPTDSWSPRGRRFPLRISFPHAAQKTYRSRRLPTQRLRHCEPNGTSRTRSQRCVEG